MFKLRDLLKRDDENKEIKPVFDDTKENEQRLPHRHPAWAWQRMRDEHDKENPNEQIEQNSSVEA